MGSLLPQNFIKAAEPFPQAILRAAIKVTGRKDILKRTRIREVVFPRQAMCVAAYIGDEGYSQPDIAALAGVADHTTVQHALKKAKASAEMMALAEEILAVARADLGRAGAMDLTSHIRKLNRAAKAIRAKRRWQAVVDSSLAERARIERQSDMELARLPFWEQPTPEGRHAKKMRERNMHRGMAA